MDQTTPTPRPADNAEAAQTPQAAPCQAKPHNPLSGKAMILALLSWAAFIASAFTPISLSWKLGAASGVLALIGFILALVSLKWRPKGLSTAAAVFSGVLVLMYVIVIVGIKMLQIM